MPRQKKLTLEQEKEIKLLQANNEMLEKTKEEAKLRGTSSAVKRIEIAQQDVISQMAKIDERVANETVEGKKETKTVKVVSKANNNEGSVFDALEKVKNKTVTINSVKEEEKVEKKEKILPKMNTDAFAEIPNDIQYDVISLPSNGECYKSKIGRIPVGFLNAYDENILTSPSLYEDGLVIDYLLKNKILDSKFDIDSMISSDADAVVLFLRATSYGADFPVSVRDPESGERFDTVVDLTQFKSKDFNLKGDENGYFSYTLPLSKDEVKFKFLTRSEEKSLEVLSSYERKGERKIALDTLKTRFRELLEDDEVLNSREKGEMVELFKRIDNWGEKINAAEENGYVSKSITNRMEMSIVSINGNTDREYIAHYVRNMLVRDSFAFRKYISSNEPGIDWKITVERPESLGGGSFETFLRWDDSIFFNIAEG